MNFNIEISIEEEAIKKNIVIISLEKELNNYINHKNYGKDVETFTIRLNCINPPKGFEHLFKLLPPKYIDFKIVKNIHTGEYQEFRKHFFLSINIIGDNYEKFISSTDEESKKILAREVLKSFVHLDKLPKKIKDFDKEKFKADVEKFFRQQNLL